MGTKQKPSPKAKKEKSAPRAREPASETPMLTPDRGPTADKQGTILHTKSTHGSATGTLSAANNSHFSSVSRNFGNPGIGRPTPVSIERECTYKNASLLATCDTCMQEKEVRRADTFKQRPNEFEQRILASPTKLERSLGPSWAKKRCVAQTEECDTKLRS